MIEIGSEQAIRWSTVAAVVGLAGVAGWFSYDHAYKVVLRYGTTGAMAHAYPATIDGLIYAASMVLLDSAKRGKGKPVLAWSALGLGIAATLLANVAAGLPHGLATALVYSWPAVPLVIAYELLMLLIRGASAPEGAPRPAPASAPDAPPQVHPELPAPAPRGAPDPPAGPGAPRALDAPAVGTDHPMFGADDEVEMYYAKDLADGRIPSQRKIRQDLHVGQARAKAIYERLSALVPAPQ